MANAKFIVLEGIDGCGKSTQIDLLTAALRARGRSVTTTREPTDGATGKHLREVLSGRVNCSAAEQTALFVLDRIEHNLAPDGIEAALARGEDVVCDRYYYSTLAYQGSVCDYEWVRHMNCACPEIRHPDLCIFLDLPPAVSLERISARGEAKEIFEKEETLTLVRATFLKVFASLNDRVAVIDAQGSPDEVAARVLAAVEQIL